MSTLSVIMPSYNYAHYLPISLKAILSQSFQPIEILVVDDASTDDSVAVVKEFQKTYPHLKLLQNRRNLGVITTANEAIEKAQGDYLAFCAADDEILPGFFEKSMHLLMQYPNAAICSSIFTVFYGEEREKTTSYSALLSRQPGYLSPKQFMKTLARKDCRLGGQNTLFKRTAILKAQKLLPQLGPMCDWFMILTLGFREGACFIPESLTKMRIHPHSYSQRLAYDSDFIKKLLHEVNQLLSKDYQDVKPYFLQAGALYQIGLSAFPHLMKKKYWEFITPSLLQHFGVAYLKYLKAKLT